MKLVRFGPAGAEKPGLIDGAGTVRDLSGHVADIGATALVPERLAALAALAHDDLPVVREPGRLGACITRPGKIIGIGLNYHDHARETGAEAPSEPISFTKAASSLCGPDDDILQPVGSEKLDWEVELGVVIGARARRVAEAEALEYVAGYCVVDDVSERSWQKDRGGQWMKGKSYDTFCPVGPWLVTADEVADPQALALWTELNGERVQNGTTAEMIFGVRELVSYLSRFMTLEPGDLIATGTPAGVGMGMSPPRYLVSGDRLRLGVEGLGVQSHAIVAEETG
ncbi:fumarylacetoacetate hydrolase family protein [Arhodomonas sp. AD133]|uniref:fumarylacetoacetate hydrolase family protein n=1 Tax=Arhodomonas sp. AD133 TaxID=3415009 RepID=UPI003EBD38CA